MARKTLALLALLGFALSGGAAMAAGGCSGFHVGTETKQTVASADGEGSTPIVLPTPKDG